MIGVLDRGPGVAAASTMAKCSSIGVRIVGALAWLAHIVVDWAFGDGLRSADGFLLGPIGRMTGIGSPSVPVGQGR